MNIQDTDEIFWDRLHGMPDVEAVHELTLRRDSITLENAMLHTEREREHKVKQMQRLGVAIIANQSLLTKINTEIKVRNKRITCAGWQEAVRAIYGPEGYFKCREWMELEKLKS